MKATTSWKAAAWKAAALFLLPTSVFAHTGHDTHSVMAGLLHPLGLDHLLAMVAVGIWSVAHLPARQIWIGPAAFLLALIVSALAGMSGMTPPFLEQSIALSVVLFGVMLLAARQLTTGVGLTLIVVAASLHGFAHGAEAPAAGFTGYAVGFIVTTAVLHGAGIAIGLTIRRKLAERRHFAWSGMGAVLGATGLYLFSLV
jgi:urease accessory protein